ncbi:MAG TPA: DUF3891 family protein [Chitinophagales bacterium]|nr:DUF3891 family protein [Chitinophagales bacterium]
MIVRKSKHGLHIILHSAHGLLAAKIAHEIKPDLRPINWLETIISISDHDDRQLNFDEKDYLSKLGVPLDFTECHDSINEIVKRMQRVIRLAVNKSSWVRLMISYHLEYLYSDMRAESKRIDSFLTHEETERKLVHQLYNISDTKGREIYQILLFCDRLSLILCKDETPSIGRFLEINKTIGNKHYVIERREDNKLMISPWIFEKDEFELQIEERLIEQLSFNSSKEFENILLSTPPTLLSWTLIKA